MWRACVLPWGRIVARVNCGEEGGKEWEAERGREGERERERERAVPGFIYPQGDCNVLPCHRPINGASLPLCLTLLPLFPSLSLSLPLCPFVILFLSIFRDSSSIIRNIAHTHRPPSKIYGINTWQHSECPMPPLRTNACTDNPSKLGSSLKRADANSRNEFSRTITIRIYRVAGVIRCRSPIKFILGLWTNNAVNEKNTSKNCSASFDIIVYFYRLYFSNFPLRRKIVRLSLIAIISLFLCQSVASIGYRDSVITHRFR